MAKSLRSKKKRKMRAIKRERYSKKELDRLKGIVEKAKDGEDGDVKFVTVESLKDNAGNKPYYDNDIIDEDLKPAPVSNLKKGKKTNHAETWLTSSQLKKLNKKHKKNRRLRNSKKRAKLCH